MAQAWYGIAITLEFEERWYEAIHYVRKAIEKDEHNSDFWLLLGDCEYNLNNISEAGDCYIKVVEEEPDLVDGWLSYAHFLTETGNSEEAIHITEKAMLFHPDSTDLVYRQTANMYSAGRIKDAYVLLDIALDKDPESIQLLFDMLPDTQNDQHILNQIKNKKNNS